MEPRPTPDSQASPGPDSLDLAGPPLSAIEAAGVVGVNERTIRRAISAGTLPATKQGGAFRISPADLAAWKAAFDAEQQPDRPADSGPDRQASGQSGA